MNNNNFELSYGSGHLAASGESPKFSVSEFLQVCNQTLEYAFTSVCIEGEISSYKESQGKWVFFDLKDQDGSINCFIPIFQLRLPVQDGMKVIVRGVPKVTNWGKFSLTVRQILPVGEGNIKKSFELLKRKLAAEGLFDPAKKRPITAPFTKIGVISSTQAAGYADFIKIINERWGGMQIQVAHTAVQGLDAADQIIRALRYLNQQSEVEVIAIIRGGGSADDLAVFNDEALVREIAMSRIPIITGIGHEVDESLCDLAADLRASTPSNAAQMLTLDRRAEIAYLHDRASQLRVLLNDRIATNLTSVQTSLSTLHQQINTKIDNALNELRSTRKILETLNPDHILARGYAILTGPLTLQSVVKITTLESEISARIEQIQPRNLNKE